VVLNERWESVWPNDVNKEMTNGQCEMETIELRRLPANPSEVSRRLTSDR
jgi:hypothetical protein